MRYSIKRNKQNKRWQIWRISYDTLFPGSLEVVCVANCETFSDILLLLNVTAPRIAKIVKTNTYGLYNG